MGAKTFLTSAISLLEQIENSYELKSWCQNYSIYGASQGKIWLERELFAFMEQAYRENVVITNYNDVIEKWGLKTQDIVSSPSAWLSEQSYLTVLGSIAWHFRRDHFQNGVLINESIASGTLLRLFRRLNELCTWPSIATTLPTLYGGGKCQSVPKVAGVYQIMVPKGMEIHFTDRVSNPYLTTYNVEKLSEKYSKCVDKEILYIGKAEGKDGLRQRLFQYMKCGWGGGKNHCGGRAIWQIEDAHLLLLAYETCDNASARERQLINAYKEKNGCLPLANWRM